MNHCDHGHETRGEIRRLPIGGDGAILVCQRHHAHELEFRRERARQTGRDKWEFPVWESLAVDQEATR